MQGISKKYRTVEPGNVFSTHEVHMQLHDNEEAESFFARAKALYEPMLGDIWMIAVVNVFEVRKLTKEIEKFNVAKVLIYYIVH